MFNMRPSATIAVAKSLVGSMSGLMLPLLASAAIFARAGRAPASPVSMLFISPVPSSNAVVSSSPTALLNVAANTAAFARINPLAFRYPSLVK